jgi:hypothetical protein
LLFGLWGLGFTTFVKLQLPETTMGACAFTLAMWAGFYPLVTTTSLSMARYWVMLAVMVPLVLLLRGVAAGVPYKAEMTLAILVASFLGVLWQWARSRKSTHHA